MAGRETEQEEPEDGAALAAGDVLDEKFRVERLLGMGGMGAVYEVTHLLTKHRRAMKLLHPHYAQQKVVVERFFREASAAGHIGNDHIIETFDAGWLGTGEPYLVMEFLDGMPLTDRIEEQPEGMELGEASEIFEQLCHGVQAAHEAGIVHRDLKPDNVFLARGGGAWNVKVLDFGVSKFDEKLATKLTSGGSMVGTPAYMSPEQFDRGADVDPPSDVYALGVILYEMITGVHPYPAETMAQLVKMILASSPLPIADLRPDLPAEVQELLDHMLEVEQEDRIASPKAAAAALKAIVEAAPSGKVGLRTTAVSDARELGTCSDPQELALGATAASDPPPASAVKSTRAMPSEPVTRPPVSLATTDVMDEEEPRAAAPETDAEATDGTPGRGGLWIGAATLVAAGMLVAVTQLGEEEPSAVPSSESSSAAVTSEPPEPTVTATATAEPAPSASIAATSSGSTVTSTAPPPKGQASPPKPLPGPAPAPPPPAPTAAPDRAGTDEFDG